MFDATDAAMPRVSTSASEHAPEYPKLMRHPGFPIGGHTGLLVKDYRGKNAEQEIWKFDAALVAQLNHTLKQAAIEEGQWTEKREVSGGVSMVELERRLNAGRDCVAAEKRAADESGRAAHREAMISQPLLGRAKHVLTLRVRIARSAACDSGRGQRLCATPDFTRQWPRRRPSAV
jgi:hypothetical protein